MSLVGRINRGLKWYVRNRDAEGKLLPIIANDPNKMKDVEAYLKAKKEAEEKEAAKTKSKRKK